MNKSKKLEHKNHAISELKDHKCHPGQHMNPMYTDPAMWWPGSHWTFPVTWLSWDQSYYIWLVRLSCLYSEIIISSVTGLNWFLTALSTQIKITFFPLVSPSNIWRWFQVPSSFIFLRLKPHFVVTIPMTCFAHFHPCVFFGTKWERNIDEM